jgi:hypothetical protein
LSKTPSLCFLKSQQSIAMVNVSFTNQSTGPIVNRWQASQLALQYKINTKGCYFDIISKYYISVTYTFCINTWLHSIHRYLNLEMDNSHLKTQLSQLTPSATASYLRNLWLHWTCMLSTFGLISFGTSQNCNANWSRHLYHHLVVLSGILQCAPLAGSPSKCWFKKRTKVQYIWMS